MTKTAKIRKFVQDNAGATREQIVADTKLDNSFIGTILRQRVNRGEFVLGADGGYTWNSEYKLAQAYAGPGRKRAGGAKVRGNREHLRRTRKAKKKTAQSAPFKTMADVARKHIADNFAPVPDSARLSAHVRTTMEAFAETLDMYSLEPMSKLAWRSLTEAVALMDAAACPF